MSREVRNYDLRKLKIDLRLMSEHFTSSAAKNSIIISEGVIRALDEINPGAQLPSLPGATECLKDFGEKFALDSFKCFLNLLTFVKTLKSNNNQALSIISSITILGMLIFLKKEEDKPKTNLNHAHFDFSILLCEVTFKTEPSGN